MHTYLSVTDRELFLRIGFEELTQPRALEAAAEDANVLRNWSHFLRERARATVEGRGTDEGADGGARRSNLLMSFALSKIVLTHQDKRALVITSSSNAMHVHCL